jgi:hypothetical protein
MRQRHFASVERTFLSDLGLRPENRSTAVVSTSNEPSTKCVLISTTALTTSSGRPDWARPPPRRQRLTNGVACV